MKPKPGGLSRERTLSPGGVPQMDTRAAEQTLLAGIFKNPALLHELRGRLSPEAFANDGLGAMYAASCEVFERGLAVRPLHVARVLNEKYPEVTASLRSAGFDPISMGENLWQLGYTDADFAEAAEHLRTSYLRRRLWQGAHELASMAAEGFDSDACGSQLDKLSGLLTHSSPRKAVVTAAEAVAESFARMQTVGEHELTGVDTGSALLNRATGGWQSSDVICLCARPGMGKTLAGVTLAEAAALSGTPVLYVSLEMRPWTLVDRITASRANIAYSDKKKGRLAGERLLDWTRHANEGVAPMSVYFYDGAAGKELVGIVQAIREYRRRFGVGLVIVDYAQLIKDHRLGRSGEYERLTHISESFKDLNLQLDIPVMLLLQLNREAEHRSGDNRRPRLADLKGTGQFEQDASIVVGLYRPDYYGQQEDPHYVNTHQFENIFLKNRDGDVGMVMRYANAATNTVADDYTSLLHATPPVFPAFRPSLRPVETSSFREELF